ncbi:MAG: hypothetical protein E5V85_16930 [Mesorhizobium sp.]|nr:MAG: hypothetical protein E5V85_16930 [Mesorhizobium sp.]
MFVSFHGSAWRWCQAMCAISSHTAHRYRSICAVMFCLAVLGCMPEDGFRHYAGAVGPDLYSRQTVANTALLDAYTSNICTQAGLAAGGHCIISTTADWKNFVDMGLYDIDQRCDTFLDGLYYKAKTGDSILAQISDTGNFTASVLDATSSSAASIKIVAAAFGLVENTFRNTNKTLLEALDATTVKSIVFRRQQQIKQQIYSTTIWNKPQALHALRTYLRVCMPFAIEMEANAVLTTAQWTEGDVGKSPIVFREQTGPLGGDATVDVGRGRNRTPVKSWESVNTSGIPIDLPTAQAIQNALCFAGSQADGKYGDQTEAGLKLFEVTVARQYKSKEWRQASVKLDLSDIGKLRDNQTCEQGARNYLERALFKEGFLVSLKGFLKSKYGDAVKDTATLDELREFVQKFKDEKGIDSGPDRMFENQITPDFVAASGIFSS